MLGWIIMGTLLGFGLLFVWDYHRFKQQRRAVEAQFLTIHTIYGPVQYLDYGPKNGPVVLFSTGGGAGIDLVYMLDNWAAAGYRLLAINRPGYYNLPLEAADSIEDHAAIYHAVVEALGIDRVYVFGVSMGGLSALYYAQNYPTEAVLLWSPLTGPYHPHQEAMDTPLGRLILSDKAKDLVSWSMTRFSEWFPKASVRALLQAEAAMAPKDQQQMAQWVVQDPTEKRRFLQFIHALAPMSRLYPGMMDEVEKSARPQCFDWSKLTMPILAYASPIDKDVSRDHFDRLNAQLVNGECRFVRAAGHFVWWGEDGRRVQAESLAFFDKITAPTA